jgi:hypothetical protein
MDRKEFLKSCVCGICACATASLIPSADLSAAEPAKPEDWRLQFVKIRYAKLLQILGDKLDEKTMNDILQQMGRHCASTMTVVNGHKGDIDGFISEFKQKYHEDITYDREKAIITVVGPERTDCFCPLIGIQQKTPKIACNCSLGWQKYTYETILGKEVSVELKESVLRGGKRCIFEISVGKDLSTKT